MNERIKQLAEQAGLEMCSCGCDMPTRQTAKFAELIGSDMLKLSNKNGNIKPHSVNAYFGFELNENVNNENIKRFVNERTN